MGNTTTAKALPADTGHSTLFFHQGMALRRIADTYPTLPEMLLEVVQNAIDASATKISISVNQKTGFITITDNGEGATIEKFETALQSICVSIKDDSKLGRFGIGLISPLGKCQEFRFISCPNSPSSVYREWTFVSEEICNQRVLKGIPFKVRNDINFRREGENKQGVPWRTMVQIQGFTKDRVVSKFSPEGLGVQIVDRYGVAMRRNKVTVAIDLVEPDGTKQSKEIRATQWSGVELPETRIKDSDAGETIFRLYQARRTVKGRKGRVLVGETDNDFRIEFKTFANSARDWLSAEVVETLSSGVFEGEILSSKARVHASRRGFDKDLALVGFCATIETWYKSTGKTLHRKMVSDRRDERHQQLARRSIDVLEAFMRSAPNFFTDLFKRLRVGSIGEGHADVPGRKVIGPEEERTLSNRGRNKSKDGQGGSHSNDKPEKENPNHHPFVVVGPSGRQRTAVKSNSLGLRIAHDAIKGSDRLWVLDMEKGTLFFNILHPAWAECETCDRDLMRLQEHVIIQVLAIQLMPEEMRVASELYQNQLIDPLVFLLRQADGLRSKK